MNVVTLLATVHDPVGKNINLFQQLKDQLIHHYQDIFLTISDETSTKWLDCLEKSELNWKVIPKRGSAHARREVLKFGLTGENTHFHYCDLDRLLTWCKYHPNELKETIFLIPSYDYLILGRTERAFQTHPISWIETENITNKICSLELEKEVDITAGSCAFSRESAVYITNYSKEKMTDAEWAMIVQRIAKLSVGYLPVEGLEFHEHINGTDRKRQESEKWLDRLKQSLIISETAYHTGKTF